MVPISVTGQPSTGLASPHVNRRPGMGTFESGHNMIWSAGLRFRLSTTTACLKCWVPCSGVSADGSPPIHAYAARSASALARSRLPRAWVIIFSAFSFEMRCFRTKYPTSYIRLRSCLPRVDLLSVMGLSSCAECRQKFPHRLRRDHAVGARQLTKHWEQIVDCHLKRKCCFQSPGDGRAESKGFSAH
jgi:hypothetical protein